MYNYRNHYEFGKQGLMRIYMSEGSCVAKCMCRCSHPQSAVQDRRGCFWSPGHNPLTRDFCLMTESGNLPLKLMHVGVLASLICHAYASLTSFQGSTP